MGGQISVFFHSPAAEFRRTRHFRPLAIPGAVVLMRFRSVPTNVFFVLLLFRDGRPERAGGPLLRLGQATLPGGLLLLRDRGADGGPEEGADVVNSLFGWNVLIFNLGQRPAALHGSRRHPPPPVPDEGGRRGRRGPPDPSRP